MLATLRRGALAGCTLSVGARSGLDSTALKTLWSDMGYDRMARPADATTGTVDAGSDGVDLQVHLLSYDLDESLQVWTPRYFFRQQWRDARLAYNVSENCDGDRAHVFLHDYEWRVAIWRPMPYTKNVAFLEDGILLSGGTWIFPDGTVFESRMINEVLSCPLDVSRMPFDTQKCEILKGNYVYDDTQVFRSACRAFSSHESCRIASPSAAEYRVRNHCSWGGEDTSAIRLSGLVSDLSPTHLFFAVSIELVKAYGLGERNSSSTCRMLESSSASMTKCTFASVVS